MVGTGTSRLTAVALAFTMLVTPALALPLGNCGESCCQRVPADDAISSDEAAGCCASSSSAANASSRRADQQTATCRVCCESTAPTPAIPSSRDNRLDVG